MLQQTAIEQVDLLDLPSMPLTQRNSFPPIPCVYFALSPQSEVMYIGRTVNLKARWAGHHRYEEIKSIQGISIAWLEIKEVEILPGIEQSIIEYFNPPLNGKIRIVAGHTSQLGIKIDAQLYEKYKTKLRENGVSITDDIENHMKNYVGEVVVQSIVIDMATIARLAEDVENLKLVVEELKLEYSKASQLIVKPNA
ncbi:MAG: hypothetical protein V7L04_14025 [Nostoc sp.]|uniref:hypothetical protein n=1 Tax=Nostoc sp. TaxID=1180 RepID=UPI002FF48F3E